MEIRIEYALMMAYSIITGATGYSPNMRGALMMMLMLWRLEMVTAAIQIILLAICRQNFDVYGSWCGKIFLNLFYLLVISSTFLFLFLILC